MASLVLDQHIEPVADGTRITAAGLGGHQALALCCSAHPVLQDRIALPVLPECDGDVPGHRGIPFLHRLPLTG